MRRLILMSIALLIVVVPVQAQQPSHTVQVPDGLKWNDVAALPGAKIATILGDPSKEGQFVYRFKFPANFKIPPHMHKAIENVTVLSGALSLGLGEKADQASANALPVGGFISVPPNHPHFGFVGPSETIVQVHGVGPTDLRFVNPADDPRKK